MSAGFRFKKNYGSKAQQEEKKISRRGFVSGAAAAAAALIAPGSKRKAEAKTFPDYDCPKVAAHLDEVSCLAFTPNGKYLVSGSKDNNVKLWDVEKLGLVRTWVQHNGDVGVLAVSPDGKYLVTGSNDNTVRVWSLSTYKLLKTIKRHQTDIYGVVITPDSNQVYSASSNGTIHNWRLPTGSLLTTWTSTSSIYSMALSPDGLTLATGHYGKIRLWSLTSKGTLIIAVARDITTTGIRTEKASLR